MMTLNFPNAVVEGKQDLVDFYIKGMRTELNKIMTKWLESNPLANTEAYPQPMAMPGYIELYNKQNATGVKLRKDAQKGWAIASHAGKVSDSYLLLTILFSAVLFLGRIESKFDLMNVRIMLLYVGYCFYH